MVYFHACKNYISINSFMNVTLLFLMILSYYLVLQAKQMGLIDLYTGPPLTGTFDPPIPTNAELAAQRIETESQATVQPDVTEPVKNPEPKPLPKKEPEPDEKLEPAKTTVPLTEKESATKKEPEPATKKVPEPAPPKEPEPVSPEELYPPTTLSDGECCSLEYIVEPVAEAVDPDPDVVFHGPSPGIAGDVVIVVAKTSLDASITTCDTDAVLVDNTVAADSDAPCQLIHTLR